MDYEERMTAAFAALDLQKTRNYSQVAKKYGLERTTLSKRYKGETVSRKVFLSESRQCLTEAQEEALIEQINKLTDRHIPPTSQMVKNFAEEMIGREVVKNWTHIRLFPHLALGMKLTCSATPTMPSYTVRLLPQCLKRN
jgi:hypothetical protein